MSGLNLPIHPVFVHFPVALFLSALGFAILGWSLKKESFHQTALHLYVVATLATSLTVMTGWLEAERHHLHHPLLEWHENLGFVTLGVSWAGWILLWFLKRDERMFRRFFIILVVVIALTVTAGAYFGGRLVYEYGVGIVQ